MSDKEIEIKKAAISGGLLIFAFLFMLLMLFLSRGPWEKGLKKSLEKFLDDNLNAVYMLDGGIKINSGFSTSAYAFKIRTRNSVKADTAVIISIPTLYGPYPAVFICSSDRSYTDFVGFIGMPEGFRELATSVSMKSAIYYWQNRIPSILNAGGTSRVK